MATHPLDVQPELRTAAGEILISHNHIALLQGLYACPRRTARSHVEWIRVSLPYVRRYRRDSSPGCLEFSARRLHDRWVRRIRIGRRIEVSLTTRGRAIVEARLPVRIRGWGTYEGFERIKRITQKARHKARNRIERIRPARVTAPIVVAPQAIREADAYAKAYGIPLLTHVDALSDLTIIAVATRLDGKFVLKGREEVEGRGPRHWHARWTQIQVARGHLPDGYRLEFSDYDEDDVLYHLRELRAANRDKSIYCRTYAGRDFLSDAKLHEWLSEEIDFARSDMSSSDIPIVTRLGSGSRAKLLSFIGTPGVLSWTHPDTGKTIGRVINPNMNGNESFEIVATNCVALSCLQLAFDAAGIGIRIETRYFPHRASEVEEEQHRHA